MTFSGFTLTLRTRFIAFGTVCIVLTLSVVSPGIARSRSSKKPSPKSSPVSRTPKPMNRPPVSAPDPQMEEKVVNRINEIRTGRGLGALKPNPRLTQAARNYSQQMAEKHFFSHVGPGGDNAMDRLKRAGLSDYQMVGENLFMCENLSDPVKDATQGWMRSPGHRENILQAGFTETGVGVWKLGNAYYFTQLFMRPWTRE